MYSLYNVLNLPTISNNIFQWLTLGYLILALILISIIILKVFSPVKAINTNNDTELDELTPLQFRQLIIEEASIRKDNNILGTLATLDIAISLKKEKEFNLHLLNFLEVNLKNEHPDVFDGIKELRKLLGEHHDLNNLNEKNPMILSLEDFFNPNKDN